MAKACSVEGCDRQAFAKGLCGAHYDRHRKHGDPTTGGPLRTANGRPLAWVIEQSVAETDDCIPWPFRRDEQGRGKLQIKGTRIIASRYMCRLVHGEPPTPKHHAAHSCGNGHVGCMNPKHLRWATPKENSADQKLHGTQQRGERYGLAKLSDANAALILSLKGSGTTQQSLADRFGVHQSTISDIWRGKRRAWMKEAAL